MPNKMALNAVITTLTRAVRHSPAIRHGGCGQPAVAIRFSKITTYKLSIPNSSSLSGPIISFNISGKLRLGKQHWFGLHGNEKRRLVGVVR